MNKTSFLGKLTGGIYTLDNTLYEVLINADANKTFLANTTILKSKFEEAKLWHIQFGHVPFWLSLNYVSTVQREIICTICPKVRQTRLSFSSSYTKTTAPFAMLHAHIWGHIHILHILQILIITLA